MPLLCGLRPEFAQSTPKFTLSYACWVSSKAGRKERKVKDRKNQTKTKQKEIRGRLELSPLQAQRCPAARMGWCGLPHHIPPPTERRQEADIGQMNVPLVCLPAEQHAACCEGQWEEQDACWRGPGRPHRNYTWPQAHCCWRGRAHHASAGFRAPVHPRSLGAAELRVCYPEMQIPGLFCLFLYYKLYILCWSDAQQHLLKFQAISAHVLLCYAKHHLTEI